MRFHQYRFIQFILRYIEVLFWAYAICGLLLILFGGIFNFFRIIYNTLDFIIYHITGSTFLRPNLKKRKIEVNSFDIATIGAFIYVTYMSVNVWFPEAAYEKQRQKELLERAQKMNDNYNSQPDPQTAFYSPDIVETPQQNDKSSATGSIKKTDSVIITKSDNPKPDSIELIKLNWKANPPGYYFSDKLPLSFKDNDLKFTFRNADSAVMVDCYNSTGLYKTLRCIQHDNVIELENSTIFFSINNGNLYLVSPDDHLRLQLSMAN